ncbi:hypothetical protein RB195_012529 [Necator americanus]|uniref:SCP domain-containing protein n=1 Tax=Necator americanus TaxID=51031 RepID=A0ABR1DRS0_NECAM
MDPYRKLFLDFHNGARLRVAKGIEPKNGGYLNPAKNMYKLVYDCKVEASALRNALRCVYGHSNDRNGLGENIYRTTALNFDKNKAAKEASQLWWDELKKFGVGKSTNLTEEMWYLKGGKIGHYTQMAWDRTRKLGCAVTHCNHMTYVVCQYGPGGNYMNKLIYSVGAPCSKCPPKAKCDRNEGLCYFA